jgi:myo-inositol-1(or 4)-monophosphatase
MIALLDQLNEFLPTLLRKAGKIILSAHVKTYDDSITTKPGSANFVTVYDVSVQNFLMREIKARFPSATFIAEEKDNDSGVLESDCCFIIDPIDGTTNFIRGLHYSCVSIALAEDNTPLLGVVFNPYTGQCYSAEKGKGAWCNGVPLNVSDRTLDRALVSVGFTSYEREQTDRMFRLFRGLFDCCEDIRSFGSAALDLCAVSAGGLDVFAELLLKPWDYAAAACIITEAGGVISDLSGNPLPLDRGSGVLAADKAAYEQALAVCLQTE